jgi:hypothetical protein
MALTMKIYADTLLRTTSEWCWHRGWSTGHDSACGLLMKFAFLNALTAPDIARLFVTRKRGMRTPLLRTLQFDLRDSENFDLDALAKALRTQVATVRGAFLDQGFPGPLESDPHLKWCDQCLTWGLHLPGFQMRVVGRCPLHNLELRHACFHCDRQIPYTFNRALFEVPFCCPYCQGEMASQVKLARTKLPPLRAAETVLIERMNRYVHASGALFKRELPVSVSIAQSASLHIPSASPGEMGIYLGFIGQVVNQLAAKDGQECLPLAALTAIRCGCNAANSSRTLREMFEPSGEVDSVFGSEQEMQVATHVYRALRRRIWRGLRPHQQCVKLACQHLLWDLRGAKTQNFCPAAAAYIRWRMLWEGCGTPRYLLAHRAAIYFGVLGWLHGRPAPYPDDWKNERKAWMLSHIFASVCLASYDGIAKSVSESGTAIYWEGSMSSPFVTTHWALSDPENTDGIMLFVPARHLALRAPYRRVPPSEHLEWHVGQLRQMIR